MRQSITHKQWFEITDRQRATFLKASGKPIDDFIIGVGLSLPLPTIGDLLAFLETQTKGWLHIETPGERTGWRVQCKEVDDFDEDETPELVDALWNAVKLLLNERQA